MYTLHHPATRLTAPPTREFTRVLHTSTVSGKDVNLDKENPFFEKYEEKLDNIKGYV